MAEQIAVRLDDDLAVHVRAEATAAGETLSDWVRAAIRDRAAYATALRARAEEDAQPLLRSDADEDALHGARVRRALDAFDELALPADAAPVSGRR